MSGLGDAARTLEVSAWGGRGGGELMGWPGVSGIGAGVGLGATGGIPWVPGAGRDWAVAGSGASGVTGCERGDAGDGLDGTSRIDAAVAGVPEWALRGWAGGATDCGAGAD